MCRHVCGRPPSVNCVSVYLPAALRLVCLRRCPTPMAVNTYLRDICVILWRFLTSDDLDLGAENWHNSFSCPAKDSRQFCFFFYAFLVFELGAHRDGQMVRTTDGGRARPVMRPHDNSKAALLTNSGQDNMPCHYHQ